MAQRWAASTANVEVLTQRRNRRPARRQNHEVWRGFQCGCGWCVAGLHRERPSKAGWHQLPAKAPIWREQSR